MTKLPGDARGVLEVLTSFPKAMIILACAGLEGFRGNVLAHVTEAGAHHNMGGIMTTEPPIVQRSRYVDIIQSGHFIGSSQ